jgi:hypothetical protein
MKDGFKQIHDGLHQRVDLNCWLCEYSGIAVFAQ